MIKKITLIFFAILATITLIKIIFGVSEIRATLQAEFIE